MSDDDFEPYLGRKRGGGRDRFVNQVARVAARAGGRVARRSARSCSRLGRIGRGAGAGRVLRDRYAGLRARRVVIKTRIVRLGGKTSGARAHLRYLERDGVARDGSPGRLYDAAGEADAKVFVERGAEDRHQFRVIVAPEDAAEYADLRDFTRRFMAAVERDLDTRLDWVAVDHHNTGHPHIHVVIRGRDEYGRDLVIAREYLTRGMRERAQGIVGLDLGPRSDREIEARLTREVDQERLTNLDRRLIREAGTSLTVQVRQLPRDPADHARLVGRLRKLERLGLASESETGVFRLADNLESTLRRMGERGDIVRTLQRAMSEKNLERALAADPVREASPRLVGRVIERGLSDELGDRHYLVVDGVDGRLHYADIGRADAEAPVREGSVVAIAPGKGRAEPVVTTLATRPLAELATADAATWLDRELIAADRIGFSDSGFGDDVKQNLLRRQQWLIEQGLMQQEGESLVFRQNLLATLRQRELNRVGAALESKLGLDFAGVGEGRVVEGRYRQSVELISGRYAVIARTREFSLVPWRLELERMRDRDIAITTDGESITIGRQRSRGLEIG